MIKLIFQECEFPHAVPASHTQTISSHQALLGIRETGLGGILRQLAARCYQIDILQSALGSVGVLTISLSDNSDEGV